MNAKHNRYLADSIVSRAMYEIREERRDFWEKLTQYIFAMILFLALFWALVFSAAYSYINTKKLDYLYCLETGCEVEKPREFKEIELKN